MCTLLRNSIILNTKILNHRFKITCRYCMTLVTLLLCHFPINHACKRQGIINMVEHPLLSPDSRPFCTQTIVSTVVSFTVTRPSSKTQPPPAIPDQQETQDNSCFQVQARLYNVKLGARSVTTTTPYMPNIGHVQSPKA